MIFDVVSPVQGVTGPGDVMEGGGLRGGCNPCVQLLTSLLLLPWLRPPPSSHHARGWGALGSAPGLDLLLRGGADHDPDPDLDPGVP